ncbi:MAG: aldo/keto reductase [Bacteroidota bacterium]|nr:aldo/keto reductase [Bacteroidota bacterium]
MKNRREFIKSSALLGAFGMLHQWASAIPLADTHGDRLPMRRLIRNGEKVTAYSVGGWHLGNVDDETEAERMVEMSMDMGVRFFDTARGYQNGGSEERMGRLLVPKYRDQIFVMTKSHARTGEQAREHLELSLKALKTDQIDLWQIHTFTTPEDVDKRIENGVLDVFLEAKEKGKARYIGFTGHQSPHTHLYFLKWLEDRGLELDTCQLPINVLDPSFESFQKQVLPVLLEKEYGIIAMKTMSGGSMMGKRIDTTPDWIKTDMIPDLVRETGITPAQLHQYVYSLPVSSLVSGCTTLTELEHNIGVLQNFKNLSDSDMQGLEKLVEPYAGLIVENYKRVLDI